MSCDLAIVLRACELLYEPVALADLPLRLLGALKPVLPSRYYSWELLRSMDVKSLGCTFTDDSGPVDLLPVQPAYAAHVQQHPFAAVALGPAQSQVVSLAELMPQMQWRRTDFYNLVHTPFGIRHQLALTVRGEHVFGALVFHNDVEFSDRDRRVLQLLEPHIKQVLTASFRWSEALGGTQINAAGAQLQIGFDGNIGEFAPAVVAFLNRHFPSSEVRAKTLPASVRRWFEEATRGMWSGCEPTSPKDGSIPTRAGRLRLTLLTDFPNRKYLVLLTAEGTRRSLDSRALTSREREVLRWISEGKRNSEIAIILGSSPLTVKTQVETILRKLGAETRGAAAAIWRESDR